jgi:endo-1,4-beta-xylanase
MNALLALAPLLLPLVAASPLAPRWGVGGPGSLGSLAESKGKKYFGTEISSYYLANEKFSNTLRSQFNQITPENEMKWEVIQPERGVFNWTGSDLILQTVKETKSYFRGHNFVWDQQTPEYVTNITDPDELKAVLKEHVDAVMGRYGEYFYAFDVINERE